MSENIKTLLTILFVCIVSSLLSGCGSFEETICKETEGQERNGLVYLPNQQEPFTGKNLCKYENGQKKVEGNYKDGYQDGKWTEWYENGQITTEGKFKDDKIDGKWTEWDEDGQNMQEGHFKDGILDGKYTRWYENGQIEEERNYKDGRQVDQWGMCGVSNWCIMHSEGALKQ